MMADDNGGSKMNIKRILTVIVVLLVVVGGGIGYTYQSERTPEHAMAELMNGLAAKDYNKVKQYADVDALIENDYDESTKILATDIAKLHELYPKDWFFCHDTAFMQDYIAARRGDDLVFIRRVLDFYMDDKAVPLSKAEGQAQWLSSEMVKFADNYTAKLTSVQKQGGTAQATVVITGKDTDYGRLVPQLTLTVELTQQADGHWMATRIGNVSEAFYPVVKGIEDYWTLQGWQ